MYSFAWVGLDHETGSPIAMFEGEQSQDYNTIYSATALEDMVFHGSAQPTVYGALHNSIRYGRLDLSLAFSYKMGYFFRRSTLSYSTLFNSWGGHGEFADRWQEPGDEMQTNVPSMVYPTVSNRESIYRYAAVNVLRGDHVRLENIRVGYSVAGRRFLGARLKSLQAFALIQGVPLVWLKNAEKVDPYFKQRLRDGRQVSFGLNFTL